MQNTALQCATQWMREFYKSINYTNFMRCDVCFYFSLIFLFIFIYLFIKVCGAATSRLALSSFRANLITAYKSPTL